MASLTRNQIIVVIVVIFIACAGLVLGALVMMGVILVTGIPPESAHTTIVLSTPKATREPTATLVLDDSLLRIKQAGTIVVGTAADYPPFAYYNEDFKLDGFDVALIRLIGERLGVQVEIKDMTFDGLGSALQIGQIDVAIAAISVTPERSNLLDFSNVYFVSNDAILASQDADISEIKSVTELADYRIGVQRASVYQDWLQTELVESDQMLAEHLSEYKLIDQAVGDLMEGRVDLVVMDLLPAEEFAEQGNVMIVGRSLNRQRYAIAVRKGALSLLAEINRMLAKLQDEGQVSLLVKEYLGLEGEQLGPSDATQEPQEPIPTLPEAACVDSMAFIQDLTLPDYGMSAPAILPPGTMFQKGWRIQNTGSCTWDSSYILSYAGGNTPSSQMSGRPQPIEGMVQPGQLYDVYVEFISPPIAGVYQGFWEMRNGADESFGERIWVGIRIPIVGPTAPTQTPVPGISLSAEPTRIDAGERVIFQWRVQNAKGVYFYAQGELWQQNPVSFVGSREVYPATTTIYELRVIKLDDTVEVRQIVIYVEQDPGAPIITKFKVKPDGQVAIGTCVNITWQVEGNVDEVILYANDRILWEDAPLSGAFQECPTKPGLISYWIEAIGDGGVSNLQRSVEVE